jgi:hypothetical protein
MVEVMVDPIIHPVKRYDEFEVETKIYQEYVEIKN